MSDWSNDFEASIINSICFYVDYINSLEPRGEVDLKLEKEQTRHMEAHGCSHVDAEVEATAPTSFILLQPSYMSAWYQGNLVS